MHSSPPVRVSRLCRGGPAGRCYGLLRRDRCCVADEEAATTTQQRRRPPRCIDADPQSGRSQAPKPPRGSIDRMLRLIKALGTMRRAEEVAKRARPQSRCSRLCWGSSATAKRTTGARRRPRDACVRALFLSLQRGPQRDRPADARIPSIDRLLVDRWTGWALPAGVGVGCGRRRDLPTSHPARRRARLRPVPFFLRRLPCERLGLALHDDARPATALAPGPVRSEADRWVFDRSIGCGRGQLDRRLACDALLGCIELSHPALGDDEPPLR